MARPRVEYEWQYIEIKPDGTEGTYYLSEKPPLNIPADKPFILELVRNQLYPDGYGVEEKQYCEIDTENLIMPEYFDEDYSWTTGKKVPQKYIQQFKKFRKELLKRR
jgi:hypothetical protein